MQVQVVQNPFGFVSSVFFQGVVSENHAGAIFDDIETPGKKVTDSPLFFY